jgi:hypothetical protein
MMLRVGRVKSEGKGKVEPHKSKKIFFVRPNFPFPQIWSMPYYHYFRLSDTLLSQLLKNSNCDPQRSENFALNYQDPVKEMKGLYGEK